MEKASGLVFLALEAAVSGERAIGGGLVVRQAADQARGIVLPLAAGLDLRRAGDSGGVLTESERDS